MTASWFCLCIDENESSQGSPRLGEFWAKAIDGKFRPKEAPDGFDQIDGPDGVIAVMVPVPEEKTVKHRVHLDLHVRSIDELTAIGATVVLPAEESGFKWTVLQDPEGGELCAFLRDEPPDFRLYEAIVDSHDPETMARWWAARFGVEAENDGTDPWWWMDQVPGMPFENLVFVPVPEPKTVKNRIHWDVRGDVAEFQQAGARVLWEMPRWVTMADPEGNEFCVFPPTE